MTHQRRLKKGNLYRVRSFMERPPGNLSHLLHHKISPVSDSYIDMLPSDRIDGGGFIIAGLRVEVITGHLRGQILTLPAIQIQKVRIQRKCYCAAHPFPHFPGTTCIKETP